jgi:hypothetical protein
MVSWVIDSGATHHMTWERDILNDITPNPRPLVFSTAADHGLEAKERGTVVVRLKNGKTLKINDVHYVPRPESISYPRTIWWNEDGMSDSNQLEATSRKEEYHSP